MGEVNKLIDYAVEIAKLIDQGGSTEDLIGYTAGVFRKETYERFPTFDPKVLEALILYYNETVRLMYEDLGGYVKEPINKQNLDRDYNDVARILGKAFMQTTKKLSGVDYEVEDDQAGI